MTVDLSRGLRVLLDGALRRANQLAGESRHSEAAGAFDAAARLCLQYSEQAITPGEQRRRVEAAAGFRQRAQQLRSGETATDDSSQATARDNTDSECAAAITALIHKSTIAWDDIAGLDETKCSIASAYALSLAQPPQGVDVSPIRNILFYGPPGCGKSLLAAATSHGLDATFFNVKVSSLLSKYFGESPKLVSAVYDAARDKAPSVIFLDEIDALAASREHQDSGPERRVLANLLSELDGVAGKASAQFVLTIAATNTPWALDAAILSRFERQIYVPLPDQEARRRILELQLTQKGYSVEMPLDDVASWTEERSGREIERFAKRLIEKMLIQMNPDLPAIAARGRDSASEYRLKVRPLTRLEIQNVLAETRADTSPELLERYTAWRHNGASE